jgi:hypothetical protein
LIYTFFYCFNLGQQDSLTCPIDLKACITIIFLVSCRCNTLVKVPKYLKTILHIQDSLSSHSSSIIDLRGSSHYLSTFFLNPPRVIEIPPLCRISPSLKRADYLSKVTVGRYSHSCPTFVYCFGCFPTYNLYDNIMNNNILIARSKAPANIHAWHLEPYKMINHNNVG